MQIRAESITPIFMVTARSEVVDRVVGLEIGANDKITKSFHVRLNWNRGLALVSRMKKASHEIGNASC